MLLEVEDMEQWQVARTPSNEASPARGALGRPAARPKACTRFKSVSVRSPLMAAHGSASPRPGARCGVREVRGARGARCEVRGARCEICPNSTHPRPNLPDPGSNSARNRPDPRSNSARNRPDPRSNSARNRPPYSLATSPRRDAKLDLAHPRVEVIPHHEDSVFFGNLARGGTSSNLPPPPRC